MLNDNWKLYKSAEADHEQKVSQSKLKKKLNYLINVFAQEYFAVLLADFTADSVEIARISEPVVPLLAQTLSRSSTYDAFLDFYCGQYIVEQEHAEFM